jgi:hypothetical protein
MHIIKVWMRNIQDNGYGSSGSPPTTMAQSLCTNKTGGDTLRPLSTAFVIAYHAVNNGLERKSKISRCACHAKLNQWLEIMQANIEGDRTDTLNATNMVSAIPCHSPWAM